MGHLSHMCPLVSGGTPGDTAHDILELLDSLELLSRLAFHRSCQALPQFENQIHMKIISQHVSTATFKNLEAAQPLRFLKETVPGI